MKKQLLIAAVAASMASVAMADIAISGKAKFNATDGVYWHEADLKVTGSSGGSKITAKISLDDTGGTVPTSSGTGSAADGFKGVEVEQLYLDTKVADIKIRMGNWRKGKSELNKTGGSVSRVMANTSFGGINLQVGDTGATNWTVIGTTLAGVKLSHGMWSNEKTETKLSGNIGGVAVKVHANENAAGAQDTSYTLSTDIQGVTLTYSAIDSETSGSSDGYITEKYDSQNRKRPIGDMDALGVKTAIAGNTVEFKAISVNGADTNKVTLTRKLAAGTTLEAGYEDTATSDSLNLQLAVKF